MMEIFYVFNNFLKPKNPAFTMVKLVKISKFGKNW